MDFFCLFILKGSRLKTITILEWIITYVVQAWDNLVHMEVGTGQLGLQNREQGDKKHFGPQDVFGLLSLLEDFPVI